jgi:hypothetical protein
MSNDPEDLVENHHFLMKRLEDSVDHDVYAVLQNLFLLTVESYNLASRVNKKVERARESMRDY